MNSNEEWFAQNHTWFFIKNKTLGVSKFIKDLPIELNTDAKKKFIKKFGTTVNKKAYILFLENMTHGGDYISMDYLFKHYNLQINPITNIPMFNSELKYKDLCEEAFYIWYMVKLIKCDPFIGRYSSDTTKFNLVRQQRIEKNILPTLSNYKFDFSLIELDILVEVNEYYHETRDQVIKDNIKNALAKLCGYRVLTLKVLNVFNMSEIEYNELSTEQIHNLLYNSPCLAEFATCFIENITSALLKFEDVRSDYILFLFKKMLNKRLLQIADRIKIATSKISVLTTVDQLDEYKILKDLLLSYKSAYELTSNILNDLNTSPHFIKLFNIKDKCAKSMDKNIITFSDIYNLLDINIDEYKKFNNFKIFLEKNIYSIKGDITDILVTWEELSEVLYTYENNSKLNTMLQMYYREVGRSYEIIIKMIKSHTDTLKSDQHTLVTYVNSTVVKLAAIASKKTVSRAVISTQTDDVKIPRIKFDFTDNEPLPALVVQVPNLIMEALEAEFAKTIISPKTLDSENDDSASEISDSE